MFKWISGPTFAAKLVFSVWGKSLGAKRLSKLYQTLSFLFRLRGFRPIAMYQGPGALDSVLNFPLYSALVSAFSIPGPQNVSALANVFEQSKTKFKVGLHIISYFTHFRSRTGCWFAGQLPRESGLTQMA